MIRDIVLIHGGGQAGWVWDETVAAMRAQAGVALGRVIVLDVPGCGAKRGRETAGLGIEDVVAEFAAELDALDIEDVMLVGHSQAGTVLPGLIAARPQRIARVVYFSCCAPLQGQTVRAMMGNSMHRTNQAEIGWPLDPATVSPRELFAAAFCNDMDEEEASIFLDRLGKDAWPAACMFESDRWHYDALHDLPGTYVVALRDNILQVEWQERFAERFHADRRAYIDAGHQAMNTRPYGLAEIPLAEAAA